MYWKAAAVLVSLAMIFGFVVILDVTMEFVPTATGITHYVNKTGSGGALTSIQDALNVADPGDTVFVYSGTYYENVVIFQTINLTGESRDDTIIDGNYNGNVVNISANWVNITGFTITHGGSSLAAGILINTENNTIYDNNITSNDYYGMYVNGSRNNIHDNIITFNYYGVFIEDSNFNNVQSNYLSNNTLLTLRFHYSNGNEIKNNEAKTGGISLWGSIQNNISENKCGIGLVNSSENKIIGNTGGIGLTMDSNNNDIIYNNASNIGTGIDLYDSHENNIINNNLSSNSKYGIHLDFSTKNNIIDNTIYSNDEYGIYLDACGPTNVINNKISSNLIWGIYMATVSGNVSKNDITSNGNGVNAFLCNSIDIEFNNISNNDGTAIRIYDSGENNIRQNLISNNSDGVRIIGIPPFSYSIDNRIYHNSFINNTNQSYDENYENYWDNGYPSGGNFWSDYSGADVLKGPNQDIPGSDGIGDTNYTIDSDSIDHYPLMKPIGNYYLLEEGWNLVSIPLIQSDSNILKVMDLMNGSYDAIQYYNTSDSMEPWDHYKVNKPFGNKLYELNESMGFWIHITKTGGAIFVYNGTPPAINQTVQLHKGWNMVGYPSVTKHNRTTGLNNLTFDTHVDCIQWYDTVTKTWHFMGPDDMFVPGRGYWMHSKVEKEWIVPL